MARTQRELRAHVRGFNPRTRHNEHQAAIMCACGAVSQALRPPTQTELDLQIEAVWDEEETVRLYQQHLLVCIGK